MNVSNFNAAIEVQSIVLENDMKKRALALAIRHRGNSPSNSASIAKLKAKFGRKEGMTNRISYTFPRQLIYTHYGAGKGKGGLKGSRWTNRYGETMKTNPRSLGKAGTGSRKAKPFIDEALQGPEGVGKLADIAAVEIGAIITGNMFVDKNNIGK